MYRVCTGWVPWEATYLGYREGIYTRRGTYQAYREGIYLPLWTSQARKEE